MKLKRKTRFARIGAPITIEIGKNEKVLLRNGQEIEIPLADNGTEIRLRQRFSPKMAVKENDSFVIVDKPKTVLIFWFIIVLIIASHLLLPFDSDLLWWLSIIGIVLVIISFILPKYELQDSKKTLS
ncbi:hypothetical protein A9Q68_04055 [Streptococcus bovimastitidis]|uniref:Uncharacterized protein n=1 Tax=Streptococcus bovimastitidis TaxID=1856638 RepID=A0A1L8MPP4_9STRE|nr:hypothetical protein [Streptococcus bovimastitidis]OJF72728.1 hypothetical protein A9Q68_04055 [Streptococcus bovimastitidis]